MSSLPTTSLVVTTYERPDALAVVLESVLRQRVPPGEVLVADDGSGADTAACVREAAVRGARQGLAVRHVWQPDEGFRAAAIRNRALAAATGDYVLLIDGDCVLHPDFVRSHAAFARPGTFVQGTRVLLDAARTGRAIAERDPRVRLLERGLRNRLNGVSAPWLSALVPSPADPLRGVRSANMGLWRADAVRVNGFNEAFVGWGREDSEFVARLAAAGVRRRKLKFGGIVYHLWHEERSRAALGQNDALYAATVSGGAAWCAQGLDGHR